MITIGIPKESHPGETRRMLLPKDAEKLNYGIFNIVYEDSKVWTKEKIFAQDMVLKLKMPTHDEIKLMKDNILFCMIHAAQNPKYVKWIREGNLTAIAIEKVTDGVQRLIDCTAETGIAGMLYAFHLARKVPSECKVLCLGYGSVATGALKIAFQLGANVHILRRSQFKNVRNYLFGADIVINALSWPTEWIKDISNHRLIKRGDLGVMHPDGVILDLSVDYPSPIETCRPTTLKNPTYQVDGITHCCIYGYPALVPMTSSRIYSAQIKRILDEWGEKMRKATPASLGIPILKPDYRKIFIENMLPCLKAAVVK